MITKDNLSAEIIKNNSVVIGTIKPEIDNVQEIRKKSKVQGRLCSIGGKSEIINIKIQGSNNEKKQNACIEFMIAAVIKIFILFSDHVAFFIYNIYYYK